MNKHIVICCLVCISLFSCGGMNDPIQEYLDRGEVNYIGKVDSVITTGGKERIQFSWKLNTDPRIEACVITWNNAADSLIFPIDRSKVVDGRITTIFDNMKEGTYIFKMYHTGKKGYNSMKQEVVGKVYSDIYQQSLTPRKILKKALSKGQVEISWGNAENSLKVNFFYTNNIGNKVTREILPQEQKTVLTDCTSGSEFTYETVYLPEENALDSFSVLSEVQHFPSDK